MTRQLYSFLIRMHPYEFRERFGDEMQLIFEEGGEAYGKPALLLEAILSLGRQWLCRTQLWKWPVAVLGGMISLFIGFGGFITWRGIWEVLRTAF